MSGLKDLSQLPKNTGFYGNHPNLTKYKEDITFALEKDSIVVFLKILIVMGSWPGLSEQAQWTSLLAFL